jgi:hypothetical protein
MLFLLLWVYVIYVSGCKQERVVVLSRSSMSHIAPRVAEALVPGMLLPSPLHITGADARVCTQVEGAGCLLQAMQEQLPAPRCRKEGGSL